MYSDSKMRSRLAVVGSISAYLLEAFWKLRDEGVKGGGHDYTGYH
jgi:hypothetical protein